MYKEEEYKFERGGARSEVRGERREGERGARGGEREERREERGERRKERAILAALRKFIKVYWNIALEAHINTFIRFHLILSSRNNDC